ncbi:DUF4221 family protein [Algoriphagus resistens]|uniref:DUF4221 family protein n=1 Tax=Algoriphagus resistens TaxID=1750590 RepID=UPI000716BF76|nr:DUF4221 family protein [Algoriphagus resistens]
MKKLLTISFLTLLSACGGKESESTNQKNILENLTFSIDTVVVDAGEDFFNINYGLGTRGLNEDKSLLMFFENDPKKLVQVDLNQLKLVKKTDFEIEGPNGIGSYLTGFEVGPRDQLFMQSYTTMGLFNTEGKKTEDLIIIPEGIEPELAKDYTALFGGAIYDFYTQKIYTQPSFEKAGEYGLFVINPKSKEAQVIPIPEMKLIDDLSGTFETKSGEYTTFFYFGVSRYTTSLPGRLILSGSPMSGLYLFDKKANTIEFKNILHQTVPNVMQVDLVKNPTDEATVKENRRKLNAQLNYQEILWDESRELYWRFGKKTFEGKEKGDPSTYEFYLFAYDKDFNVLGETKLDELETEPRSYFFKEGKLYSYVNVEDKLGFAVFTFNF